ncbi:mariner Mos1 transposase [Trichonephila clavipes]|nr:mariner Mos1 transposase [Trichonephila clavipes]
MVKHLQGKTISNLEFQCMLARHYASNSFWTLEICSFVLNIAYLKEILLHLFYSKKKSAAEAHSILVETYADNALSETTCIEWFRRFKINDFEEDKEYSGTSKKFEEKEWRNYLIKTHVRR